MTIEIILRNKRGDVLAKRTCEENWEIAEMNLESLKIWLEAFRARENNLARGMELARGKTA